MRNSVLVGGGVPARRRLVSFICVALAGSLAALGLPAMAAGSLSVSDVSVVEGNSGTTSLEFTISATCDAAGGCALYWDTVDGTATAGGGDYMPRNGFEMVMGMNSFSALVPVNGDTAIEPDEAMMLFVQFYTGGGIAHASGTGTILNDDFESGPAPDPVPGGDGDADGDGVPDARDNCPGTANPDQADINRNSVGDACDPQVGGDGDDVQQGTDGDDVQVGGRGDDVQRGGGGNDAQFGDGCGDGGCVVQQAICPILDALARGSSAAFTGPVNALRAAHGCDASAGKAPRRGASASGTKAGGNDSQSGGRGLDFQLGDFGNDSQKGGSETDLIVGGPGADRLVGGPGHDIILAGLGADLVDADDGEKDLVKCGPGHDRAKVDRRDVIRRCETVS